jgi:hypothetical protein
MYPKDLLTKPDDELTDYERQLKYGENGDPRQLNPYIDQALALMEEADKWNVDKVFQKSMRVSKGHANSRCLWDLVKQRIMAQLKEQARKSIQSYLNEHDALLGFMTEDARWHYARANLMTVLFEVTGGGVALDELAQVADEAIADCIKANQGGEREPEFRDSQTS